MNWSKEIYQARINSKISSLRLKTLRGEVLQIDTDIDGEGTYSGKEKRVLSLNLRGKGLQLSAFQNLLGNKIISDIQGTCEANLSVSGNMIYSELELKDFAAKIQPGGNSVDFAKDEISLNAKAEYNKGSGNIKVRSLDVAVERLGKLSAGGDISGLAESSPKLDLRFNISPIPLSKIRDFLTAKKLFRLKEFQIAGISEASGIISGVLKEPEMGGSL